MRGYHASLEWVLRHERATLLVTAATLVITIGLYVIVPKGFLPLQDTGLITAVMEAGPEVSFAEMERLQNRVGDVIRKDPDVEGVVSVIGVSALNPTPNAGHLKITLKAARAAHVDGDAPSSTACRAPYPACPASSSTSSRCRTSRSARGPAAPSISTRW